MERGEERKKQRKERESVIEEMYEMVWGGEEIIKLQVGKGGNGRSECKGVMRGDVEGVKLDHGRIGVGLSLSAFFFF